MQTFKMNNGLEIPAQGFGTFQIKDHEICKLSVSAAIGAGYRMIDTASMYMNEEAVAEGIKLSGVPREEIFISTKVWLQHCGYENVRTGLKNSLRRLDTDYVDLYLIHWPFVDLKGTWKAMEELVEEGKIKSIGVCNCDVDNLKEILDGCKIVPVVNQLETHPINQQKEMRKFQKEYGILTEAWGVLGRAMQETMQNEVLNNIAEKHGKSTAQVMLRWCLQEGMIGIPRSTSVARIVENSRIWDFELTEEDMELIHSVDTGKRLVSRTDPKDPAARERLINMKFDI